MELVFRSPSPIAKQFCQACRWALTIVLTALSTIAADSPSSSDSSFSKEIAPILVNKCMICHNAQKAKGGYRMESFETLMKGGDSKEAPVVPGEPNKSKLYQLIISKDPDDRMPQKADPLSADQVEIIAKWIKQGALFDRPDKREAFSAFVPRNEKANTPAKYRFGPPIVALAFNTNGEELAASGYGEVTFWNPGRGTLLRRVG